MKMTHFKREPMNRLKKTLRGIYTHTHTYSSLQANTVGRAVIIRTILSIVDTLISCAQKEKKKSYSNHDYPQLTAPNTPITNRLMTNDTSKAIPIQRLPFHFQ